MFDADAEFSDDDPLDIDLRELWAELPDNKRVALRHVRKDIDASLRTHALLNRDTQFVKLGNVSSKGAAIICHKKLELKSKVTLILEFDDGKRFDILARVAHRSNAHSPYFYGLKFEEFNHELSEHLLATQADFNIF